MFVYLNQFTTFCQHFIAYVNRRVSLRADTNMSAEVTVPTELVADTSRIVEIVEIPDVVSLV